MSARIEMIIRNIVPAHSHGAYTLYLKELNGIRILPIIIGGFEAQSIAMELEGITASRPLTHDLFSAALKEFSITVDEITIERLDEGIYFAEIACTSHVNRNFKRVILDSRTSDAIALGIKFKAPIFCAEKILEEAAYSDEHPEEEKNEEFPGQSVDDLIEPRSKVKSPSELSKFTMEELQQMLETAINEEEYSKAASIRDEIKQRK
ncbi:MAG: hypothetical protein EXR17_06225 [Flavobacteriaceae bacterium]|nr:hypothetical protein [Flavobacteriaceae bacterium]